MSKRWSDYVDTGRTPMYSESFKRKVVAEVESELLNKDEARRKYNIGGKTTVLRWCRKYGKLSGGKIKLEESIAEVKTLVEQAVLLYNNMRPHMSCQLQTPSQAHRSTSCENERGLKFICEPFFTISTNRSVNLF